MMRTRLSYLLIAPLLMLCAACVSEEGVPEEVTTTEMTLRMKINMGLEENTPTARADKGEPDRYDPASGKFEEIATLRVIILHGSDREVEGARLVATSSDGTPLNDNLEFKVASNEKKTIVLIANEESLTPPAGVKDMSVSEYLDQFAQKGTKISDSQWKQLNEWKVEMPGFNPSVLEFEQTYTKSLFSTTGLNPRLPLTEIWEIETLSEAQRQNKTDEVQEVTLFMTRAAAKATFHFDIDPSYSGSGSKVTGIKFCGVAPIQTVFPQNAVYSPAKYTASGEPNVVADGKRFITYFTPADLTFPGTFLIDMSEDPVEIKPYGEQDAPVRGPIYFAEYRFPQDDRLDFTVAVELDGNDNWLKAQPLTDNILLIDGIFNAIARNTHLEIHITFGSSGITAETRLVPYTGVHLDPIFGVDRE